MSRRCSIINNQGERCANPAARSHRQAAGPRLHFCEACDRRLNPTYRAPADVAHAAARALQMCRRYRRGGTFAGIACARSLAKRRPLRLETIEQMHAYFESHEVDRLAYGFYQGEDDYPSAGRVSWDLWGGDRGREWAARIVEKHREQKAHEASQSKAPTRIDPMVLNIGMLLAGAYLMMGGRNGR